MKESIKRRSMRGRRMLGCMLGAGGLATAAFVAAPSIASAASAHECSGSPQSPGVLAGDYFGEVRVEGACEVNSGPATVHGTLILRPGSVVLAAFGLNHKSGHGGSSLSVTGGIRVLNGATLILGCLPRSFACFDDPTPNNPTLMSAGRVGGGIHERDPLGVIVHNSTIGEDVTESGGGGGFTCDPSGVFTQFGSPVFSDYEDSTIGGNLNISRLTSCWLGVARVHVGGSLRFLHNRLKDPDAIEILDNHVAQNLVCRDNSMVWDSFELSSTGALFPRQPDPNTVGGERAGQCVLASPKTADGHLGPGPF